MFNRFFTLLNNITPQIILDQIHKAQQGTEHFALNELYIRAESGGITESKSLFPLFPSVVVVTGDKSNLLEITSYGNGSQPDPVSRKPLEIIEKMAGTENIINMKGVMAQENRKKIKPFLSDKSSQVIANEVSLKWINKILNSWNGDASLQDNISYFTTNVVAQCVLGIPEISFDEAQIIRHAGRAIAAGAQTSLSFFQAAHELSKLNDKLLAQFSENIQHTSNYTKEKAELKDSDLDKVIADKLQKTRSISNLLVEANLSTLITTALIYVNKNQEIAKKMREELSGKKELDIDTLRGLPYLHCLYKESLRFASPTAFIERETSQSVSLNITDDKGHKKIFQTANHALLFVPIRRIHFDPKYWEEPQLFKPERFYNKEADKHFLPFSLGQRSCPAAANFNEIVFKTALVEIIKYKFELDKEIETVPVDALSSHLKQDYFATKN